MTGSTSTEGGVQSNGAAIGAETSGEELSGRDPMRIDATLAAVAAYWKLHPDMRLGQLIVTLSAQANENTVVPL